jgi:acetylornithine deacetylase/succinyl-diaminopimelate desuccinylase-like protein
MSNGPDAVEILKKLISIPSPYYHEDEICIYLESQLKELGFTTYRQEVRRTAIIGGEAKELVHFNVLGEKGQGEKSFLLYAHIDTVPVVKAWKDMDLDPFTPVERNGSVIGLGACDMKAGAAAILRALQTLNPEGYKVKVVFSIDEENVSAGANVLIKSDFIKDCAGCIVPEVGTGRTPSAYGKLILGRHGRCSVGVRIRGRAAHASTPEYAVNPIIYALELIESMEWIDTGSDTDLPPGNISVASIHSGIGGLSSPEECTVWFDFLYSPPRTSADLMGDVNRILRIMNEKYILEPLTGETSDRPQSMPSYNLINPLEESVEGFQPVPMRATPFQEPYKTDADHPLVICGMEAVRQVLDMEPELCYGKSNADENSLSEHMPVLVIPPVGGNEHQAAEFVEKKSVEIVAKLIETTVEKYMTGILAG